MDELKQCGDVQFTEFFLPESMPKFCTGCQLCFGYPSGKCPHFEYVEPIKDAILDADALIFTTPHHAGSTMSACMKNLLDHIDFFAMTVTPHEEIFRKKAFILTTGTGSTSAIKPIKRGLKHWAINRVYSLGLRMFSNKWANMPEARRTRLEQAIRRAARKFYAAPIRRPYLSTVFMYYLDRFIMNKYIGEGNYPYEYWREKGFLAKRPF